MMDIAWFIHVWPKLIRTTIVMFTVIINWYNFQQLTNRTFSIILQAAGCSHFKRLALLKIPPKKGYISDGWKIALTRWPLVNAKSTTVMADLLKRNTRSFPVAPVYIILMTKSMFHWVYKVLNNLFVYVFTKSSKMYRLTQFNPTLLM